MADETKPRIEVATETKERLEVLELDRTPRPEKLARETALLEGASEVRFTERAFRPKVPFGIEEIRRRVDALDVRRSALPEVPPLPPPPEPPAPAPKPVSDAHRAALAAVVDGDLVSVESVYRTATGEVVEATWETRGGARETRTFVLEAGAARPVDDIVARVDDLPDPVAPPQAPQSQQAQQSQQSQQSPPKKRFGLPLRKKDAPDAKPEPKPSEAAEEPKKRRFGFRRS